MNDSKPLEILQTAGAVIDAVGGTGAAAKLSRASISSVSNWRRAGRFNPRTFLLFREALTAVGAAASPSLWSIDEPETAETALEV